MQAVDICRIGDIPDNNARGYTLDTDKGNIDIFIVRHENRLFAYINRCPHTGINLEWQADRFLDSNASYIQCSMHGARFRISDGFCIHGPCNGQSLTEVPLSVENGKIRLFLE